ncbi:hypothetical protein BJ508DRAFT_136439 [Ascobolus immersus RN42]|uniref:Uncharacterized protein n=1 Tax=Ascobolus immersus RN42 TaxID=1160509 RepID=A0A3N4IMK7_ASCIM|nr:hypothetical protein BJ508DRAFT_136439 [Ascobolus immersus RN42]
MSFSTNQQVRQSDSEHSRAASQLLDSTPISASASANSTIATHGISPTTSKKSSIRCPTASVSRFAYPTHLFTFFATLLTYITLVSPILGAPVPGPAIEGHQIVLTGRLDGVGPPRFLNHTTSLTSAVETKFAAIPTSTTYTTTTSTTTSYLTITIHPTPHRFSPPEPSRPAGASGYHRTTGHPDPAQTSLPHPSSHQSGTREDGQVVPDSTDQPRVWDARSSGSPPVQSPEAEHASTRTQQAQEEEDGPAKAETVRMDLKRRNVAEEQRLLAELARHGFGVQDVADMDIKKLVSMMAPKKASKRSKAKKPKPSPKPKARDYGDAFANLGRRNAGAGAGAGGVEERMLLSDLLYQKVNFGGMMGAMPSGNI